MEANLRILKSMQKLNDIILETEKKRMKLQDKQQKFEEQQNEVIKNIQDITTTQEKIILEQQEFEKDIVDDINEKIRNIQLTPGPAGKNGRDGKDGRNGKDGKDGVDGKMGATGKTGADGKNGKDGQNGVGIYDVKINEDGDLIITLTNGQKINCGRVRGRDGVNGIGVSVVGAEIKEGHLYIRLNTGKIIDAGSISGGTVEETDPIFTASPAYNITTTDINNWNNKSEFSGNYNDLEGKPINVSDFINDAEYLNQLYYSVVLNADGTINNYSPELNYETVKANLISLTTNVYLDVIQGTSRFYISAIQDMDVNNGPIKFIGIYNKDGNKVLIEFNLYSNNTLTVEITLIESLWNKKTSIINNLSDVYFPTTNAVYNEFKRKPVLIYDRVNKLHIPGIITAGTDSDNGLLNQNQGEGTNRNITSWNITGMDLSEFKYIRVLFSRNDITSAITGEFNIPLDGEYITNGSLNAYVSGISMPYYAVRTRLVGIGCAISSDKTSFTITQTISLTATTLGMVATTVNDMFVTKIEGYYD